MKRILSIGLLSGLTLFIFTVTASGQQVKTPKPDKTEKHIKMVKVDDNGKKVELDTVIHGDQVFVWQGDTIGGSKEMKWLSKDEFKMDSIHQNFDMNFEYEIKDDGEGNVMIMKSGKGDDHMFMGPVPPGAPFPPHPPKMIYMGEKKKRNVIDLSDPGIISYDKKIQKDGTEKITIVRKPVEENEDEEVIFDAPPGRNMMWIGNAPGHKKTVKVIKSDDGTTKVFEDDELINMTEKEGTKKFITEDGKTIILKESKEGDQKKVDVEVEKKVEKENN